MSICNFHFGITDWNGPCLKAVFVYAEDEGERRVERSIQNTVFRDKSVQHVAAMLRDMANWIEQQHNKPAP